MILINAIACFGVLFWIFTVVFYLKKYLIPLWKEPFFKNPILVFESDDWGPGPASDADSLYKISDILIRHKDKQGSAAVMTIGLILSIPKANSINIFSDSEDHPRRFFCQDSFIEIYRALQWGIKHKCFFVQLHGMEHFYPEAVFKQSKIDSTIYDWLHKSNWHRNEELPPHLQTRWADTSDNFSIPIEPEIIFKMVEDEVYQFKRLMGVHPKVAVPPVFIWTSVVEKAYKKNGIEVIVTPGKRFIGYDKKGRLLSDKQMIRNGEEAYQKVMYIVRNDYFEPASGHSVKQAINAIHIKTNAGRPTLIEIHRNNFISEPKITKASLEAIDILLKSSLKIFPELYFFSPKKLVELIRSKDPEQIERSAIKKMPKFVNRVLMKENRHSSGWISGWIPLFFILNFFFGFVISKKT